MKNRIISLALLGTVLGFTASCSDEETFIQSELTVGEGEVLMTAPDFLTNSLSRTSFEITMGAAKFTWSKDDKVGIFPDMGGSQHLFHVKEGAETSSAVFNGGGWSLTRGAKYSAYFPAINLAEFDQKKIPVDYSNQTFKPTGIENKVDLSAVDYMAAQVTTPGEGNISFNFQHLGCLIELTTTLPKAASLTQIKLTDPNAAKPFVTNGTFDLTKTDGSLLNITPTQTSDVLSIQVQEVETTTDNQNVKVYFMVAPMNLADKWLDAELTVTGAAESTVNAKIFVANNFLAGHAYRLQTQSAAANTYHVAKAGTLSKMVVDDPTELTITGELNGDDINYLREKAGGAALSRSAAALLQKIDLSGATIVTGGTYATTANTLSTGMFGGCTNLHTLILPQSLTAIEASAFAGTPLTSLTINGKPTLTTEVFKDFDTNNCTLQLTDPNLRNEMLVVDPVTGTVKLKDLPFQSIQAEDGKEFFKIDVNTHTIITSAPGFITREHIDKARDTQEQSLTVVGPINGDDLRSLREAAGCTYDVSRNVENAIVKKLDLSQAELRAGGKPFAVHHTYGEFSSTENDVLGRSVFAFSLLTDVKLPKDLKKIDKEAFFRCERLVNITIPSKVESIGSYAYYQTAIRSIEIPKSVNSIGEQAFTKSSKLNSVTFQEGTQIQVLPNQLFWGCIELTTFNIPASVHTINHSVFNGSGLISLLIPRTVKKIGGYIISKCTKLQTITVEGEKGETDIDGYAFYSDYQDFVCSDKLKLDSSWRNDITFDEKGLLAFKIGDGTSRFKNITDLDGNPLQPDVNTNPGVDPWIPDNGEGENIEIE